MTKFFDDLNKRFKKNEKDIEELKIIKPEVVTPQPDLKHNHSGGDYVRINMKDLTGTVQRHLILDAKRFKLPAANYPAESFEGLYYTLNFDKDTDESANCQEHVPFRWAHETDIEIEIDWLHDSVDAGVVVWGIEYKSIKAGEAVTGAGTTITQASIGSHTAGQLVRTKFTDKILGSALEEDDILGIRFYRDADNAADTLAEDARAINVHFVFIMDKIGKKVV